MNNGGQGIPDGLSDCSKCTGDQCSGCNKKVSALKQWSIESAPRILMVDFVRYNFGKKNNSIIEYPKEFNL